MISLLVSTLVFSGQEAEALSSEHLAEHTTTFELIQGASVGPGADALLAAARDSAVVLLGELHGSKRLSEWTRTLIPALHDIGTRHFGLEVGRESARILDECGGDREETVDALFTLNSDYATVIPDDTLTPIPFFSAVEDAEFLSEATSRGWSLLGLDQEFLYGYELLFDRLVELAAPTASSDFGVQARKARAELVRLVDLDKAGKGDLPVGLDESLAVAAFFDSAAAHGPECSALVDDLRTSIEIYRLYSINDWWSSNGTRIAHMKRNLHRELSRTQFDWSTDRLFLKMGGVHTARGLTGLNHYEIGSTLAELCELHGRRSLHILILDRYQVENDVLVDLLESDPRYEVLRRMGRPDAWVVIDLRPLRKAVLYDWLSCERYVKETFKQHDFIVIPPADDEPTPNFETD